MQPLMAVSPKLPAAANARAKARPVRPDRDKQGLSIPLGAIAVPANRHHDAPLPGETLEQLGPLPQQMSVHPDRAYDTGATRKRLGNSLIGVSPRKATLLR